MLQIRIPAVDQWDEVNEEFVSTKEQILTLEHSLVSISKWESKWQKPFLRKTPKTFEETVDYVRCMNMTQNVNPKVFSFLTVENMQQINAYIESPMSATTIRESPGRKGGEEVTSELIYYWMVAHGIPFECQKWHLNRLLTLIRICNIKNQPTKKQSRREILSQNAALNAARRKQLNSRG